MTLRNFFICLFIITLFSCEINSNKDYKVIEISKEKYANQLYGFWLGQLISNWTGLITEMDKIGNIGEVKTGEFYTRNDWGKTDQRSIWEDESVSKSDVKIDYVFRDKDELWGSDDDTDIEYMYQYLLNFYETSILTPSQIKAGWLKHIKREEENFLWVSNQRAFDLMIEGILPPETSDPSLNENFDGGGTYFERQKFLLKNQTGHVSIHPGNITHRHGARPIENGVRYVLVTFSN